MSFFDRTERAIENFEVRQEERFLAEERWEMEGAMFDPYLHGELFYDPFLSAHGVMYNGIWHPLEPANGGWMFAHPARYNMPRYYQPQNLMPPQMPGMQGDQYAQQNPGGYGQGGYPQQQGGAYNYNPQHPMQGQYQQPQSGYAQQQGSGYNNIQQPVQGQYPQPQGGFGQSGQQDCRPMPQIGTTSCPRCTTANAAGTHFCINCGNDMQAQSATQPTTLPHCTACGTALTPGAHFCANCDHKQ